MVFLAAVLSQSGYMLSMRQDCQSNKVMSYLTPAYCCVRYPCYLGREIYQYRESQWKNSTGYRIGQLTLLIQGTSDLRHICLGDVRPVFLELRSILCRIAWYGGDPRDYKYQR